LKVIDYMTGSAEMGTLLYGGMSKWLDSFWRIGGVSHTSDVHGTAFCALCGGGKLKYPKSLGARNSGEK
jgi:hypothetical protein